MTWAQAFGFPYAVVPAALAGGVLVVAFVVTAVRWLLSLFRGVARSF